MDCCGNSERLEENVNLNKMKGGKNIIMEKRIVMWVVIAALFLAVLYLTFKAGNPSAGTATNVAQAAGNAVSSSGMVGGC